MKKYLNWYTFFLGMPAALATIYVVGVLCSEPHWVALPMSIIAAILWCCVVINAQNPE